jgi:hypothetical protein
MLASLLALPVEGSMRTQILGSHAVAALIENMEIATLPDLSGPIELDPCGVPVITEPLITSDLDGRKLLRFMLGEFADDVNVGRSV